MNIVFTLVEAFRFYRITDNLDIRNITRLWCLDKTFITYVKLTFVHKFHHYAQTELPWIS